jgi:hypothetical protein
MADDSNVSLLSILRSYGRKVDYLSNELNLMKFVMKKLVDYLRRQNHNLDTCEHEFTDDDLISGQERKCLKCDAPEELVECYILCRDFLKTKN